MFSFSLFVMHSFFKMLFIKNPFANVSDDEDEEVGAVNPLNGRKQTMDNVSEVPPPVHGSFAFFYRVRKLLFCKQKNFFSEQFIMLY